MSLQVRFAWLLALVALSAGIVVGSALWSIHLLDREVAAPFASVTSALDQLGRTKRDVWTLARLLLGEEAPRVAIPESPRDGARAGVTEESPRAEFERILVELRARVEALSADDAFVARAGGGAWRNLAARMTGAMDAGARWWESGDEAARHAASEEFLALHELLERAETETLRTARLTLDFGKRVRSAALVSLGLAVGFAALMVALGALRVRWWVLRPVGALRQAAARIGAGEFTHRVALPARPGGGATRDELALLASEVNHMAEMVASMQQERVARERLAAVGEMVRRIVHNLRTPLSGIRALAEDSLHDIPQGATEARENQARIMGSVDRFERWLADLLAGTTALDLKFEPRDPSEWLGRVVDTLRPMAEARGVSLRLDTAAAPDHAEFDPRHLEQAVVAVITNAVQVSGRGSEVRVVARARRDPGAGPEWEVEVSDEGPGIPPELLTRIFDEHFTTKADGTGMGLALTKQVMTRHAGQISVSSGGRGPGAPAPAAGGRVRGATFVMRLPVAMAANAPSGAGGGGARGQDSGH